MAEQLMISEIKYGLFKYEVKDYYAVLGVPIDADAKQIRLRYLKIAYNLHPDTCRLEDEKDKKRASQILSKLVNPAYENLYKDRLRKECQLILSEIGRKLASDADNIPISTDTANKLKKEEKNQRKLYKDLIEQLSKDQYENLDKLMTKIALLSELNMVYLILEKQGKLETVREEKYQPKKDAKTPIVQSDANISGAEGDSSEQPKSRLDQLIDNAKQRQESGDIQQGILYLRDALKLDPNSSKAHALIASLYLEEGNLTYAKIHAKKAITLDPSDKITQQIQSKLNEEEKKKGKGQTKDKTSDKSSDKSSGGKSKPASDKSKDKKGKDKKEAPKIFGIPLW